MYIGRIADKVLGERLGAAGAVLIEGPRACGKTETARQRAASEVLLDIDENARQAMAIDPALVLAGDRPRLISAWRDRGFRLRLCPSRRHRRHPGRCAGPMMRPATTRP